MKIYQNKGFDKNNFKKKLSKIVDKYLNKYKNYSKYLPIEFLDEELEKFCDIYDYDSSVSPQVSFEIYIKNKIIKRLVDFIINEDIELEIELIEKYTPITNYIISRMNLNATNFDTEEVLISALETYKGDKFFSLHILDTIRKNLNKDDSINGEPNYNEDSKINAQFEIQDDQSASLEENIAKYIINKKFPQKKLSYIENLFNAFNLIDNTSNEILKKYIYLKFGYYKGIYFTNKDIAVLLNISESSANSMYQESLYLLKEIINKNIDLIISDNIDISPSKKYIKSKIIN